MACTLYIFQFNKLPSYINIIIGQYAEEKERLSQSICPFKENTTPSVKTMTSSKHKGTK